MQIRSIVTVYVLMSIDPSNGRPALPDRFRGCLLGHALGDGMGAPFEGLSTDTQYRDDGATSKIFSHPPVQEFIYTDDTEIATDVAECLVRIAQRTGGRPVRPLGY